MSESPAQDIPADAAEAVAEPQAPQPEPEPDLPVTIIEPQKGWIRVNWREIWQYRGLLYFLTWRDVKVRYKQTFLGALWAILQPFMSMVVFSIFFGRLGGLNKQTGDIPYPIFVYAGLLPWQLFSQSLSRSSESVVGSSNLITKVYFPRLIIPMAATGACFVDFGIAFLVLVGMMFYYGIVPGVALLLLPVFIALTIVAALGIGTFISALNVAYRDFRYVIPFTIQLWLFVTPVIYPVSIVPERWRWILALNPMSGVINGCRSAILGETFDWTQIGISSAVAFASLFIGIAYYRKTERRFADII